MTQFPFRQVRKERKFVQFQISMKSIPVRRKFLFSRSSFENANISLAPLWPRLCSLIVWCIMALSNCFYVRWRHVFCDCVMLTPCRQDIALCCDGMYLKMTAEIRSLACTYCSEMTSLHACNCPGCFSWPLLKYNWNKRPEEAGKEHRIE